MEIVFANTFANFAKMVIRFSFVIFIYSFLTTLSSCQKETTDNWSFCAECDISEWVGEYAGQGDYYSGTLDETEYNVPVSISIENPSGQVLKIIVDAENKISTTFTSTKNNNTYYCRVNGSNKSLDINLSKDNLNYKLSGTIKLYHYDNDIMVIDQSISFDLFK
tara:strand:- start:7989 stop:8480 length:492 start_codon:yes stop_codon:yes gene_type:complete